MMIKLLCDIKFTTFSGMFKFCRGMLSKSEHLPLTGVDGGGVCEQRHLWGCPVGHHLYYSCGCVHWTHTPLADSSPHYWR